MSLSKLSDKCNKCRQKDTCDNKRMEACLYINNQFSNGGLVSSDKIWKIYDNGEIPLSVTAKQPLTDEIIESISRSLRKNLNSNITIKVVV